MAPHGIPVDLLDRLSIIRTLPYSTEEMSTIISIRARVEGVEITPETVQSLATVGDQTSLRYAVQLLAPSNIIAKLRNSDSVSQADVDEARLLFADSQRSARIIQGSSGFLL